MASVASYGDTFYRFCPVCEGPRFEPIWKIPFTKLPEPVTIHGKTVQYCPMFGPARLYEYSRCDDCESIFLNPYQSEHKKHYASQENPGQERKISKAKDRDDPSWKGYRARYDQYIAPHLPSGARNLLDAACGGGQYLELAKEEGRLARLVGLELSPIAVEHLRRNGIEAIQYDCDAPEPPPEIEPSSIDFVIFSEAFEHVEFPLRALRNLVSLLRPGGRLFFSAQRNDATLPVRPAENQSLTERGMDLLLERLDVTTLVRKAHPGKWLLVVEKR